MKQTRQTAILLCMIFSYTPKIYAQSNPNFSIIPDSTGTITEAFLQYDPLMQNELIPLYQDLFSSLSRDIALTIICPSTEAEIEFRGQWESKLNSYSLDYRILIGDLPISIWARDRLLAREQIDLLNRAPNLIPLPRQYEFQEKYNELIVHATLAVREMLSPTLSLGLDIEGGNIVSNLRHAFIGANVLEDNMPLPPETIIPTLQASLGKEIVLLSDRFNMVPNPHMDMYMIPIDEKTVMMGNPVLGRELLGMLCDDGTLMALGFDQTPYWCPSVNLQDQFDEITESLEKKGYTVHSLPAIFNGPDSWAVSYTNVIMDDRDGKRIVYMPIYDIPVFDQTATSMYQRLGFEVRKIDVSGIYKYGGALRCVFNVTQREPSNLNNRPFLRRSRARKSETQLVPNLPPNTIRRKG